MKFSESWLREWVNPTISSEALCDRLTMAGLEVEEHSPVSKPFSGVIIGEVTKVQKHPEGDRLNICDVSIGTSNNLSIVCGAANVKAGIKVPVAMLNAVLPNDITIKPATIRGVASQGMLCSAKELGLAEESEGLMILPADAPLGKDIRHYLALEDYTLEVGVTPNRGDCLSVRGIAREVSALTKTSLTPVSLKEVKPTIKDTLPVSIQAPAGCPHYVGRVIRNVKADAATPSWMQEKLRRSGIRTINPIVDVTNYVMLELGQPMHAFDLQTIQKEIVVRLSNAGEKVSLLDGSEKELDANTLVIADKEKPLAIAGVMGGLDSSVTLLTRDIFLESAYFSPVTIARQRQYYALNSDSSYRFERGVDPTMQCEAIERATALILEIAGGEAGPVIEEMNKTHLPAPVTVRLPTNKITRLLGMAIPEKEVIDLLERLHFIPNKNGEYHVPSYRLDVSLPEDLIEEIARLYGYDKIPTHTLTGQLQIQQAGKAQHHFSHLRQSLSDQGYHEIVSYSFVDKKLQQLFDPGVEAEALLNPITADMAVMRTNLWPGLANTLLYNKSRQQHRIRLFEIGVCFEKRRDTIEPKEALRLAGLITGLAFPEQWGMASREADFFDLKGNVLNVLKRFYPKSEICFDPDSHPALHPGQTAAIFHLTQKIGILGAFHPTVLQTLDLPPQTRVFGFEIDLSQLPESKLSRLEEISKFPEIRRDLAIIVNQAIPAKAIQDTIRVSAGDWLKDVFIFDVYQGKGISPGLKSIAAGLILQHPTRTLIDDEVTTLMEKVVTELKGKFGAELRS